MIMKTKQFIALFTCIALFISCESGSKKPAHKEIKIEKKKVNDTLVKATVTTVITKGEEVTEDIQSIEGTPGEVNAQLERYKKEMLQAQGEKEALHAHHDSATKKQEVKKIKIGLNAKSNSTAEGMVSFTEENGKVTLEAHINGLTEGIHAIHIHEKADCSSEDGKSSGGHWNPTFEPHGSWGAESGYHRGDIGNFSADASGHGMITFSTDQWCLGCADETKNLIGKAVIVHQGEDDLSSQPSGAAGARVSCAGIIVE